MSRADRLRWERRWAGRGYDLGRPEPFLLRNLHFLLPGTVLDVAAGAGRNALLLAARGFSVTALDISRIAIARLRAQATAGGLTIRTRVGDLDDPACLCDLGTFDDLLVVRYKPSREQWRRLLARLRPGGRLLLCSFGLEDHAIHGTRPGHCLSRAELEAVFGGEMRLLLYERFEQEGRRLEGSIWERRSGED